MKLIHCADIHLDSKMESNLSSVQARERNRELCATFGRMVAYAREQGVKVVMISGDWFDSRRISAYTAEYVLGLIRQAEEVDFLYLRGNHDESRRAFAGRELPPNLKTFSSQWRFYEYGDITIAGVELGADAEIYENLTLHPDRTNIVMLHGQVATRPGEDAVCLPMLQGKNIHYLALGHLHSYHVAQLDLTGKWCYCGCLEGRGFDECGEKGFVLLDAEKQEIRSTFIPFAKRQLHEIPVDITGLETVPEILRAVTSAGEKVPQKDLVKFVLTGSCTPDTQKDPAFLKETLEHRYYFVKITDESHMDMTKDSYEDDISLKGEFIRQVMASDLPKEEQERMIAAGIQALRGEEIRL